MKMFFLSMLLFLFVIAEAQAQNDKQVIDAIQRKEMRDSLRIIDAVITQIFLIRNKSFDEINHIRSDTSLLIRDKEFQIEALRKKTNESIKGVLGDHKYMLYTDMIRIMAKRRNHSNPYPLAGEYN